MRKQCLLLLFIFPHLAAHPPVPFELEKEEVLSFFNDHHQIIASVLQHYEIENPAAILALVGPEVMRYHMFRDFLETSMLEKWYVEYGAEKADFSIGPFQMKPSFIEALESQIKESSELIFQFRKLSDYTSSQPEKIRAERIQRLKNLDWQLHYACCFYKTAEYCYNGLENYSITDKIHFYATAYNYGFQRSVSDINSWQKVKAFPYGKKHSFTQLAYGDLAVQLYQLLQKAIPCQS